MPRVQSNGEMGRITLTGQNCGSGHIDRARMRVFDSYALVYCFAGRASYRDANGLDCRIVPGDIILVFPELPHAYGAEIGQTWSEYFFVFEGPIFDLWRKSGFLDSRRPIHHAEPVDYWLSRFQSITRKDRVSSIAWPLLEVCRFQQVLAEVLQAEQIKSISEHDLDWAAQACALLEADQNRENEMPGIADKLGMSYESFRKRFTRIVGIPPARYRYARIIEQACQLMHQTDLSNKEIAFRLGFCDEFHFSHRFKQIMGRSPRAFRKNLPNTSDPKY